RLEPRINSAAAHPPIRAAEPPASLSPCRRCFAFVRPRGASPLVPARVRSPLIYHCDIASVRPTAPNGERRCLVRPDLRCCRPHGGGHHPSEPRGDFDCSADGPPAQVLLSVTRELFVRFRLHR